MGYSSKPSDVRADLFKETRNWLMDLTLDMDHSDYEMANTAKTVRNALLRKYPDAEKRFEGMTLVCLEPYCKHPYPVMIKLGENKEV